MAQNMGNFFTEPVVSKNECIVNDGKHGVSLYLKREDLLHPTVSGNKFRKLKYNLLEAKNQGKTKLLTFGGAFSNHISATAAAGKEFGFQTIGVIRGEELSEDLERTLAENSTLQYAVSCGMELHFISRKDYREKNSEKFLNELKQKFGDFYLLPEGGTNALAILGCQEILSEADEKFDYICCPVGTGGTLAGIINASKNQQRILGFSALKANFLEEEVKKWVQQENWEINTNYHFRGYAKVTEELIRFINTFKTEHNILLDPIYTGKMLFGIYDLIEKGFFPANTKILAVHTGGLQGVSGMNSYLEKKGMSKIAE